MSTTLKLTAAALAVAALAGCDHGLGVSGSSSTSAGTSAEVKASTETSVSAKKTLTATVRMSGTTLATAALTELARSQLDPASTDAGTTRLLWAVLLREDYTGPHSVADGMLKTQEALAKALGKPLAEVVHVVPPFAAAKLSPQSAYVHAAAALAVARVASPIQGWPFACFGCAKEVAWARGKAREVAFSNLLETQLLSEVRGATLADPAAARAKLDEAFARMPDSLLQSAWVQAARGLGGRVSLDFSGSQPSPIHFMIGSNDLQGGPTGWKLAQAGTTWYGDGKVSGRDVSLDLASAIDTGATTSTSTGLGTTSGTESAGEGVSSVK